MSKLFRSLFCHKCASLSRKYIDENERLNSIIKDLTQDIDYYEEELQKTQEERDWLIDINCKLIEKIEIE